MVHDVDCGDVIVLVHFNLSALIVNTLILTPFSVALKVVDGAQDSMAGTL